MDVIEIQLALEQKKARIGANVALKLLRSHKVAKILLASNVAPKVEDDIKYYGEIANVPIEKLEVSNDELTVICKRPFIVNVVSFMK